MDINKILEKIYSLDWENMQSKNLRIINEIKSNLEYYKKHELSTNQADELISEFENMEIRTKDMKIINEIRSMLKLYNDNNFLPEIKTFKKSYESNNQNCLFEVKGRNNLHGGIIKVFGVLFDINNTMTCYPITKPSEQNSYFLVWNYEKKQFEFLPCEEFEPIHENIKDY